MDRIVARATNLDAMTPANDTPDHVTGTDHITGTDHVANCSILHPGRTPAEAMRAAAAAGYREVEFWWPFAAEEPSESEILEFAAALDDAGVRLVAINLWAGDMAAGERGVLHERMLSDGHLAAVRRLRELTGVSMGNLLPGAGGPEVTETQRRHVRAVAEALPGFTPLIEPLSGNPELPVRDPWTAVELCRETGAGLLLDVFHLAELGVHGQLIDGAEYERQDPAFKPGLVGALHFPGDAHLRPDRYVAGMADALRALGGVIDEGWDVTAIDEDAEGVVVHGSRGTVRAREVVLATGAWSTTLMRSAGLGAVPVQPGKGYSITYDRPALVPKRPVILHEPSVCVTVWDSGYRLGSTMEMSGYSTDLNPRRLQALERGAAVFLHDPVGPVKREEWYGWRPLSVDDVPIIGRVPGRRRAWVATGHGMMGVSMSPATGQLVADMITGNTPRIDPAPYSPERFR